MCFLTLVHCRELAPLWLVKVITLIIGTAANWTELLYSVVSSSALLPVSEEVRSNLRPGNPKEPDSSTPPYPGKLENSSMAGSATSLDSQVSIVITTASSSSPNGDPNDHRFVWPTECQNTLLNPGIVNDTQTQALLLTTLVMSKKTRSKFVEPCINKVSSSSVTAVCVTFVWLSFPLQL